MSSPGTCSFPGIFLMTASSPWEAPQNLSSKFISCSSWLSRRSMAPTTHPFLEAFWWASLTSQKMSCLPASLTQSHSHDTANLPPPSGLQPHACQQGLNPSLGKNTPLPSVCLLWVPFLHRVSSRGVFPHLLANSLLLHSPVNMVFLYKTFFVLPLDRTPTSRMSKYLNLKNLSVNSLKFFL